MKKETKEFKGLRLEEIYHVISEQEYNLLINQNRKETK